MTDRHCPRDHPLRRDNLLVSADGKAVQGARARTDDTDTGWRAPADREQARQLLSRHRRQQVDLHALGDDETANLARQLWQLELDAARRWARTAPWTSSRMYYPPLPSSPPEGLAEWTPTLRQKHGVAAKFDEYERNLAETRRLVSAQQSAYARRR
ncbi:MAG: hypothetical protein JO023_14390 [Chloroflexi bacterium]|nr:hypothetical protein [Chloroflexota bacterium]